MSIKTFSLLSVSSQNDDGTVNGSWVQDCVGSYDDAVERARQTSELNSGIHIAVIEHVNTATPWLDQLAYQRLAARE